MSARLGGLAPGPETVTVARCWSGVRAAGQAVIATLLVTNLVTPSPPRLGVVER